MAGFFVLNSRVIHICALMKLLKKLLKIAFLSITLLLLFLIIIGGGFGEKEYPKNSALYSNELLLFAHRGDFTSAPENTMEAILSAKQKGFIAAEIDIQESADNRFFVFHDVHGKRLLSTTDTPFKTNLEDIKNHHVYFRKKITSSRIPSLEEVITEFGDSTIFYFDMKGYGSKNGLELAEGINTFLEKYNVRNNVLVASISTAFLFYLEFKYPETHTVLEGLDVGNEWLYYLIPKKFRPDFLGGRHENITEKHINWLKKNNMMNRKVVFSVKEKNYSQTIEWGFKKIIVDYGNYLDSTLSNTVKQK